MLGGGGGIKDRGPRSKKVTVREGETMRILLEGAGCYLPRTGVLGGGGSLISPG